MKSKMCENSNEAMPGVTNNLDEAEEVLTINIFNNNENVDDLKTKLKEIAVEEDSVYDGDLNSSLTDTRSDAEESQNCDNQNYDTLKGKKRRNGDIFTSEQTEFLCLSTETLIDNVEGLDHDQKSDTEHFQRPRNLSGSGSDSMSGHSNGMVTKSSTKVTSGLLISPSSLTQDVHVTMSDDKQRMSAVLDSLDLHLVYIPTTQQLIATKKSETLNLNGTDNNVVKNGKSDHESETESSGYMSGNSNGQLVQNSDSPIKMATTDSSSVHSIQLLSPGNLDDTSSVNETDCLIRITESGPYDSRCDSNDFLCNFPRINTNDSLLRTFTDASSLSSLSTGTDFSVSAASLDDGEGTGHCIDTGDGTFMEINLHSKNSFERNKNPSQDSGFEDKCSKPKRKGLTGLLTR